MEYPVPTVRLVIPDPKSRVLILKRQQEEYLGGKWCLPGGKVEYGETVEQAVMRELTEETALTCTSTQFLFYQDSLPLDPGGMHCINLYFDCTVEGEVTLNKESVECRWIGSEDVARYDITFRNDDALRRYWAEGNLHR